MTIRLPEKVKYIIDTLRAAGYEGYAVGGCVRDSILGREPDDWDITTSAKPEQVKELFRRTVDTGIQHGTVTVLLEKEGFEVTTYRIDGEYEDSRHPREVVFTASLEEDLKRRDFTINAMAYNDEEGIIDLFDGMGDMERKVIRAVGVAKERFTEDALRIMRAVRFAAQLGYQIEDETKEAIRELAPNLKHISAERVQVELVKLLVSPHPDELRVMYDTGVTKVVLPEFDRMMKTEQNNPHHCYNVGEHTLHSLTAVEADKVLRLSMLFHDMGKPEKKTTDENGVDHFHGHAQASAELAKQVLRRLKFDNDTIARVSRTVLYHDYKMALSAKSVRRGIHKVGEDIFPNLFAVKYADVCAQSDFQREEKLKELSELRRIYEEILDKGQCVSLKELAVNGSDLIVLGMKPGKEIGAVLARLLEAVLEEPELNTKGKLEELAKVLIAPLRS
ncbi:MAG: CCA tRNA nucleotidyltransferase [Lachnospiraceae bacterium]|nr:CCA tRNA nucleotidyltransferase [Lachnospiraceae bacterium]